MLKINQIFGVKDGTLVVDTAKTALDLSAFRQDADIIALKEGTIVSVDANGFVALATEANAQFAGFLVNDVAGKDFENVPAYASGLTTALIGGGIVETDVVVEDNITPGTPLYISANGILTSVDPGAANVFAVARTANSAADKTITVQF